MAETSPPKVNGLDSSPAHPDEKIGTSGKAHGPGLEDTFSSPELPKLDPSPSQPDQEISPPGGSDKIPPEEHSSISKEQEVKDILDSLKSHEEDSSSSVAHPEKESSTFADALEAPVEDDSSIPKEQAVDSSLTQNDQVDGSGDSHEAPVEDVSSIPKTDEKESGTLSIPKTEEQESGTSSIPKTEEKELGTSPIPETEEKDSGKSSIPKTEEKELGTSSIPETEEKEPATSSIPKTEEKDSGKSSIPKTEEKEPGTSSIPETEEKDSGNSSIPKTEEKEPGKSSIPETEEKEPGTSSIPETEEKESGTSAIPETEEKESGSTDPDEEVDTLGDSLVAYEEETDPASLNLHPFLEFAIYKVNGVVVGRDRRVLFHNFAELLVRRQDIRYQGFQWDEQFSWTNETSAPNTYTRTVTEGLRVREGTQTESNFGIGAGFSGLSFSAGGSTKRFSERETSRTVEIRKEVAVPAHSRTLFYQKRYIFRTEVWFWQHVPAWTTHNPFGVGRNGTAARIREIANTDIYAEEYATLHRELAGTGNIDAQSVQAPADDPRPNRQFDHITRQARNMLNRLGISG